MTTHYQCVVGDQLLGVTPDSSLSSTKAFGCNQDSPVIHFFDYQCMTDGSSSPSPTIPSNWSPSSETSLSSFGSHNTAQPTLFHANVEAYCPDINNAMAHDIDSSGYLVPGDGVSQLDLTAATTGFGDYGTEIADNHWSEPHFQVFSFGNEGPRAVHTPIEQPAPNSITRASPAQRTLNLNLGGCKSSPSAMRRHWIHVARSSRSVDESEVQKVFSKRPKSKVATDNTLRASALRRKHPARFKCPVIGCGDDFTRKHNLENHLRSHCGVTDLICPLCDKGFTTIPVWKRHQKSCSRTRTPSHPKAFLAMITTEGLESKVLIS